MYQHVYGRREGKRGSLQNQDWSLSWTDILCQPWKTRTSKRKYNNAPSIARFVEFPDGGLIPIIRAESLEQANLLLDILGLPKAFPTTKEVI